MVMNLSWSVTVILKAVATVLESLGISLTVFRLYYRIRIRRFWWEDAWALLGLLCTLAGMVSGWVHVCTISTSIHISIMTFWIYTFAFTCVVWSVRMSIILSITRMVYPNNHLRYLSFGVTALFATLFSGLIIQKGYYCGISLDWYTSSSLSCHLPRPMAIFELVSDVISDIILVSFPLRLLWRVKLPKRQRRMFLAVFSSSLVMSMVSMFHATTQLRRLYSLTSAATDFEIGFCLNVCNLLVVVAILYRIMNKGEDEDISHTSNRITDVGNHTQSPRTYFTTVDLEHLTGPMDMTGVSRVTGPVSFILSLTGAKDSTTGGPKARFNTEESLS
ncbi:hypothetical protein BJ138DRAFT_1150676 [Hygrophoropsis aurantiaca]|uniref:Uncharacterized protein n=1 Tax=Hygrophoropsis aurantiaca TaxID=72124 RepID=A0ACB8AFS5_9AGAM|nr:hypothetical protein BJ138DRAFT_1150676 [Hygrophoropsis aurantiaca]